MIIVNKYIVRLIFNKMLCCLNCSVHLLFIIYYIMSYLCYLCFNGGEIVICDCVNCCFFFRELMAE